MNGFNTLWRQKNLLYFRSESKISWNIHVPNVGIINHV